MIKKISDAFKSLIFRKPKDSYGETIIKISSQYLGHKETGYNSSPLIDAWLKNIGAEPGQNWCAAYVYSMCEEAAKFLGLRTLIRRTGRVTSLWFHARNSKEIFTYLPEDVIAGKVIIQPADIFIRVNNKDHIPDLRAGFDIRTPGHTGFCTGHFTKNLSVINLEDLAFETQEGNTNEAGSRNGNAVVEKFRYINDSNLVGFIRPKAQ